MVSIFKLDATKYMGHIFYCSPEGPNLNFRVHPCSTVVLYITLPTGDAQVVLCYSAAPCTANSLIANVTSTRDCCLGRREDGMFYGIDGSCVQCNGKYMLSDVAAILTSWTRDRS